MTNRIQFIDGLRGFTISLVVYHHLCAIAFPPDLSFVNNIFLSFRMPLFFFISGFFVYSHNYTKQLLKKRFYNRIIRQLYPSIIIGMVYGIICMDCEILKMWSSPLKGGYWFTIVSVEMFSIVAFMIYLFHKYEVKNLIRIIILITMGAVVSWLNLKEDDFGFNKSVPIWDIVNISQVTYYMVFFIGGIIFKMFYENAKNILHNIYILLFSIIVFLLSFYWGGPMRFNVLLNSFVGIFVMLSFFSILYNKINFRKTKFAFYLEVIGKKTLEIYLIHYFFIKLFAISPGRDFFINCQNTLMEVPVYSILTVIIVLMCLMVVGFLKVIKLHGYIFPTLYRSTTHCRAEYR